MKCRICNHVCKEIFQAKVLNKYNIKYYLCPHCSFLQTEEPFWIEEAYKEPINIFDTGILFRNIDFAEKTSTILYYLFDRNAQYLDYAGGYGIFTRLMRDIGFNFYWKDLHAPNLVARGFEYDEGFKNNIELITSFESFEHFVSPPKELEDMFCISRNILLTTELLQDTIPGPNEWWYYAVEHGQHISFYSKRTFQYIAKKYNLNFYTYRNFHLLTEKNINRAIFKLMIKYCKKWRLINIVKRKMHSRINDDMKLLLARFAHL